MSGYRLPAPWGDAIDRARNLVFSFDGETVSAFAGDTLAAALIASGRRVIGRSFKLHRPRGIFSCGIEEPAGLLDVGVGRHRSACTRATDVLVAEGLQAFAANCWPSLRVDAASLNSAFAGFLPAGFYYKTFMWPHWHLYEPAIRRLAGLGTMGVGADPDQYDEVSRHVDVLVVGAGVAGIQAALSASRSGRQVMLMESQGRLGGWLDSQMADDADVALLASLAAQLNAAGIEVRRNCTVVGLYDHLLAVAVESSEADASKGVRESLLKVRARHIVLATGSIERPMLFPDNDRPGVMLAGAVERYVSRFGVACGRGILITTASDSAYRTARQLRRAGLNVVGIVDRRKAQDIGDARQALDGVPCFEDSAIIGVHGRSAVAGVRIANAGRIVALEADTIASAGGWTPTVSLYSQAGGKLRWLARESMFVPDRAVPGLSSVGACGGCFSMQHALEHAASLFGPQRAQSSLVTGGLGTVLADSRPRDEELRLLRGNAAKQFVDLQNDVTTADVALAARENYRSVEHLKRYTTMGMATDQGKTSNVNALVLMGLATQRTPDAVGTTKFRPPFKPVTLSTIAGGRTGPRFRPLRLLQARAFHHARGAQFEEFSGWERPAGYPSQGEALEACARREAMQVRAGVGLFDGSPLGKLEIHGPDAARFLDLMYVGTMSALPVGAARYGLLLNENGVIVDDGIVARLGPSHFWVNTTSGGVERIAQAFEEWLQCEFTDLRVFVVPVTGQWGNVTVAGPRAWQLLERLGADPALAPSAMKHMTMRSVPFEGREIRVLRASFSGELSYEINVARSRTHALLASLWLAGQDLAVCMYGIEALMVMRIEKGFLHVGADTDGTSLPQDVGFARGTIKKEANFVGRRSLLRPAGQAPDRGELVGVVPVDRRTPIPVGAHLAHAAPPGNAEGHVTSSCDSPAMGHPIALAMLNRGMARHGEILSAWHLGRVIKVQVVSPTFFDPQGERLHG